MVDRRMTLEQVNWALMDIKETLAIWRDEPETNPYVAKLWREWDELLDYRRELEK